jgi:F0F1-type ATP synthase beta subunit
VDAEQKAAPAVNGYQFIAEQEVNQFTQRLTKDYNNSTEALKAVIEESDVEDFRHYFY